MWSTWKLSKLLALFPLEAASWDLLYCSSSTLHVVNTKGARTAQICLVQHLHHTGGDYPLLPLFKEIIKPRIFQTGRLWFHWSGIFKVGLGNPFLSGYCLCPLFWLWRADCLHMVRREKEQVSWKLLVRSSVMGKADSSERTGWGMVFLFTPLLMAADGDLGCARAADKVPCLHMETAWFGTLCICMCSTMRKAGEAGAEWADPEVGRGCWWGEERSHSPFLLHSHLLLSALTLCPDPMLSIKWMLVRFSEAPFSICTQGAHSPIQCVSLFFWFVFFCSLILSSPPHIVNMDNSKWFTTWYSPLNLPCFSSVRCSL